MKTKESAQTEKLNSRRQTWSNQIERMNANSNDFKHEKMLKMCILRTFSFGWWKGAPETVHRNSGWHKFEISIDSFSFWNVKAQHMNYGACPGSSEKIRKLDRITQGNVMRLGIGGPDPEWIADKTTGLDLVNNDSICDVDGCFKCVCVCVCMAGWWVFQVVSKNWNKWLSRVQVNSTRQWRKSMQHRTKVTRTKHFCIQETIEMNVHMNANQEKERMKSDDRLPRDGAGQTRLKTSLSMVTVNWQVR